MEFLLERTHKNKDHTLGVLSILHRVDDEYLAGEGKEFICDTLEPIFRGIGWKRGNNYTHKAAIPPGRYPVVITYSEQHRRWLPQLLGVPKFSKQVRIVEGNTVDDIDCGILVGVLHEEGHLLDSKNIVNLLKNIIVKAKENNEGVFLTITNKQ